MPPVFVVGVMPRPPDSTTDTYLDVLRTLGVPDAVLRRHHDAGPETSLRVAVDADLDSPTDDLLAALDATGRVLDVRDGLAPDDGDRLTATFGRFGYVVDCEDTDGDDVELLVYDAVAGEIERARCGSDAEAVRSALADDLFDDALDLRELLDGRLLVAERRELAALVERYGPRIEPFDAPLLAPDDAVDGGDFGPPVLGEETVAAEDTTGTGDTVGAEAAAPSTATGVGASRVDPDPDDRPTEELDGVLAGADESTAAPIEAALSSGGPRTHTVESENEESEGEKSAESTNSATVAPADSPPATGSAAASIGGGPNRTVSTNGIDDVFDQLESTAADGAAGSAGPNDDAVARTTSESAEPQIDPDTPSTDASDGRSGGAGGGPTRTVSSTSADDILDRATGESDFETVAAEAGAADPDAVLADDEEAPDALGDDLVGEDLELLRGSDPVGDASAPGSPTEASPTSSTDRGEQPAADGPLAAAGGVAPGSTAIDDEDSERVGADGTGESEADDEHIDEIDPGLVGRFTSLFGS